LLSAIATAACLPARAEPATSAQAEALMAQIQPWVNGLLGPGAGGPRIVPDGDHYRVSVPVGDNALATASLSPLDQGRWALDDIRLPPAMHLSGAAPAQIDVDVATQTAHAVIDPAFAMASSLSANAGGIDVRRIDGPQTVSQHADRLALDMAVLPVGPGRANITQTLTAESVTGLVHDSGDDTIEMAADRLHVAGHLDGVNRDQVGPALAALRQVADPAGLGAAMLALRDIATGGGIEESVDSLRVSIGGLNGAADHVAMRLGAIAPEGLLAASLKLAIDGASLEMLPPDVAALVPKHLKWQQSIGEVRVADLAQLAVADDATREAAIDAMFEHGPISLELASLTFDMGPALLSASGKIMIAGPSVAAGAVRITAEGFDALMQQVRRDPLTDLAYPMLLLARGVGKQMGGQMVWDITTVDGQIRVNDTDIGSLLGR
jgi:hypothetical protein